MRRAILLKAIVIIVPVLVAVYANNFEKKKQEKIEANTKNLYAEKSNYQ